MPEFKTSAFNLSGIKLKKPKEIFLRLRFGLKKTYLRTIRESLY